MNAEQALNILMQAAEQFRGTAQEHRLIQQAGETIMNHIKGHDEGKEPLHAVS